MSIAQNRYFQYRAVLESDGEQSDCTYNAASLPCAPELTAVTVTPLHFDAASPSITPVAGVPFCSLSSFNVMIGANGCPSAPRFQLSLDGASWFYRSAASGWTVALNGVVDSNSEA